MGRKIECTVEDCDVEFKGRMIPGVVVTCIECEHAEEAGGRTNRSVNRCLAQMCENCPQGEGNFYVPEGHD